MLEKYIEFEGTHRETDKQAFKRTDRVVYNCCSATENMNFLFSAQLFEQKFND